MLHTRGTQIDTFITYVHVCSLYACNPISPSQQPKHPNPPYATSVRTHSTPAPTPYPQKSSGM